MKLDRSPDSVERVFAAIRKVHARWPDLRVGQIVVIVLHEVDIFNIENDDFATAVERWLEHH